MLMAIDFFFTHIVSDKIAYHGNRCLRTLLCSIVVINSAKPLLMENSSRPAPFSQSENLETIWLEFGAGLLEFDCKLGKGVGYLRNSHKALTTQINCILSTA